jgi:hypothetical protein
LTQRILDTVEKMGDETSWLATFEARPVAIPQNLDKNLFAVDLECLTALQVVGVLQSTLYQAGYAVQNLVHDVAARSPDLADLTIFEVRQEAKQAMVYLQAETEEWDRVRQSGELVPTSAGPVRSKPVATAGAITTPATVAAASVPVPASIDPVEAFTADLGRMALTTRVPGISDGEDSDERPHARPRPGPGSMRVPDSVFSSSSSERPTRMPMPAPVMANPSGLPPPMFGNPMAPQAAAMVPNTAWMPATSAAATMMPGEPMHVDETAAGPVEGAPAGAWPTPVAPTSVLQVPNVNVANPPIVRIPPRPDAQVPPARGPSVAALLDPRNVRAQQPVLATTLPPYNSTTSGYQGVGRYPAGPTPVATSATMGQSQMPPVNSVAQFTTTTPRVQFTMPPAPAQMSAAPAQPQQPGYYPGVAAPGLQASALQAAPVPTARYPAPQPATAAQPTSAYYDPASGVWWAPQPPVIPRPVIDRRMIEDFDGTAPLEQRKSWWKHYVYLAQAGMWTTDECCSNMALFLHGPAKAWFNQLGSTRKSWASLQRRFWNEFCVPTSSAVEDYYEVRQIPGQTPRQTLWRLNAVAARARMDISSHAGLKHHIARFIKIIDDADVRYGLIGKSFLSISDLEDTLRLFEEQLGISTSIDKPSRATRSKDTPKGYERRAAAAYPVYATEDGQEYAPTPMDPVDKQVRFADEDEDPEPSEETEMYVAMTGGRPTRLADRPPRGFPSAGRPAPGSPRPSRQASPGSPRSNPGGPKCYECQGYGHLGRDCPNRIACELCHYPGHTAANCWRKCPLCGEIHVDQECKLANELKEWAKAKAKAEKEDASSGSAKQLN